jgi:probable phosphoglycerate mutase
MKHLYFCRHGLSQLNVEGKWAGTTETPLTDEGRAQAKLAGKHAKNLGIEYILCSPLSRAHDTATIIAKEIGYPEKDIDVNSLVVERHFGELEGQIWRADFNLDDIIDIETVDSVLERARLTLKHVQTVKAGTILVVSHGAFGRALRHIINPDIPFHGSDRFENAKIVKLI